MNSHSRLSRRQWLGSGLATCGYLATGVLTWAESPAAPLPEGYTKPGPVTDRGRAPKLQIRVVSEQPNGEKTYAVIFGKGDEVMCGLTEFAEKEKITGGHFSAIGALSRARFGWFDVGHQAYRDIVVDQQVEMISLIGDVGMVNGVAQIHAHGSVGFPDGSMRGGHLLEAIVFPTLEVFFTALPLSLTKKKDDETTLSLFDLAD